MSSLGFLSYRLADANELLGEMCTNRASNIHQVTGQMIKGEYDDESNWQMVEYVFDKLNSEGCELGMRFYNALLEALWWLGQRERAAKVLKEATKRGLFPELFRNNKLVWSVDVHRYQNWLFKFFYFQTTFFIIYIDHLAGCGKVVHIQHYQFG